MGIDASLVGRQYSTDISYEVSREKIREFATAIGDENPIFHDPLAAHKVGYSTLVAPPTFSIVLAMSGIERFLAHDEVAVPLNNVVHGSQAFVFRRPIVAGDVLSGALRIAAVRAFGGNQLVSTQSEIVDEAGLVVATADATLVITAEPVAAEKTAVSSGVSRADSASVAPLAGAVSLAGGKEEWTAPPTSYQHVAVGAQLRPLKVHVRRPNLIRYAGASGDFNPIHWSDRVATAMGLPGVIAHGMYTMALAGRVVTNWINDPAMLISYGVRFAKPLVVPDDDAGVVVHLTGTIKDKRDNEQVGLELNALSADGQKILNQAKVIVQY